MKRSGIQRKKKCKVCKGEYQPMNSLQKACSPACALALVDREKEQKAAKERKESRAWIRKQKQDLKTRGQHMKEAQQAFNAYIRARDKYRPCISCGAYQTNDGLMTGSRVDAGHYRSVGSAPELRFEELNCWAQCTRCNQHLSGNTVDYRKNLLNTIGQEALDWLEGPHEPKKYTIQDLEQIKAHYRKLTREIERKAA
ncbi:recombination protein NinG [Marinobacter sp. OP 3.4]|uniref:recombination protein NinG n=1 Tax=Marinobacter sp. OP 3.4 TaxID=3076501 RepID=UPI002E1F67C3